jgi:hypothetical protein
LAQNATTVPGKGRVVAAKQRPYLVAPALGDSVVAGVFCVVVDFLAFFLVFFEVDWLLVEVFFMSPVSVLVATGADEAGAAIFSVEAGAGAVVAAGAVAGVAAAGAFAGAAGAAVWAAAVSDTAKAPAISALNSLVMVLPQCGWCGHASTLLISCRRH